MMECTVEQVAELFKVNHETVRRWLKSDKIKGVKTGGIWVIDIKDVQRPSKKVNYDKKGKYIDITGSKFGKLIVLSFDGIDDHGARWLCKCECGNEKVISGYRLKNSKTRSCGCIQDTNVIKAMKQNMIKDTNIGRIKSRNINKNNTSGVKGVCENNGSWLSYIGFKCKVINLGRYANKEDAIRARKEAEEKYFKTFLKQLNK